MQSLIFFLQQSFLIGRLILLASATAEHQPELLPIGSSSATADGRFPTLPQHWKSFHIESHMTLASVMTDWKPLSLPQRRTVKPFSLSTDVKTLRKFPQFSFPVGRLGGLVFRNGGRETTDSYATTEVLSLVARLSTLRQYFGSLLSSITDPCWAEGNSTLCQLLHLGP